MVEPEQPTQMVEPEQPTQKVEPEQPLRFFHRARDPLAVPIGNPAEFGRFGPWKLSTHLRTIRYPYTARYGIIVTV